MAAEPDTIPCSCGATIARLPVFGDFIQYQHGDNPEHCLRLTALWCVSIRAGKNQTVADVIARRVWQWTEEIHRWERGEWPTSE